jgi:thiosulfate reductase cytochrome b subunit
MAPFRATLRSFPEYAWFCTGRPLAASGSYCNAGGESVDPEQSKTGDRGARPEQPWLIRLAHWFNLPLLVVLAGSGLQILAAYPYMGPRGAIYPWYPFQGWIPPGWLRLGDWLAGARAMHFGFGWFFIVNGLLYLGYLFWSGEWRRRLFFPRRDAANAVGTALYYARVRREPPPSGFYNGLQRLAYTSALILAILAVLSGLAIWKPVQFSWLTWSFGGYDSARLIHLVSLAGLVLFTAGHVVLVLLHPGTLLTMVTGGATGRTDGHAD